MRFSWMSADDVCKLVDDVRAQTSTQTRDAVGTSKEGDDRGEVAEIEEMPRLMVAPFDYKEAERAEGFHDKLTNSVWLYC